MLPAHASAPKSEPAMAVFAAYLEHLRLRGRGNTAYTQAARSFLRRWPHVQDWADIALHRQLATNSSTPSILVSKINVPFFGGGAFRRIE